MPCFQAVVCLCDLATAVISVLLKLKGKNNEKSVGSSAIVFRWICGVGELRQIFWSRRCTIACKRDIRSRLLRMALIHPSITPGNLHACSA